MAISKGHRFPVEFDDAFPNGLVMMGEVRPDTEFQSREDKAKGRMAHQRRDEVTNVRQWKVAVTDPGELNTKRASFEVTFVAEVQPVPTTVEVVAGMRPVELEGLTAEPRVAGNGEFKYQSFLFRATGFRAAPSATGSGTSGNPGGSSRAARGEKVSETSDKAAA